MFRSLIHFWRMNLAVVAGAAVATAVLTGALVVGDSVRGSLAALSRERLGTVEHAVVAEGLFREALAAEVAEALPEAPPVAPVLALQGTAEAPGSGSRAGRVAVWGVDEAFPRMFPGTGESLERSLERQRGAIFPPVVINGALARELGVGAGDDVLLSFERPTDVPRETLLGRDDPASVLDTLRLTVATVLEDRGVGGSGGAAEGTSAGPARFGLVPHQLHPANAFVALDVLQRALDRPGQVNALMVAEGAPTAVELAEVLRQRLTVADLGLTVAVEENVVTVASRELLLRPGLARTVEEEGRRLGATLQPVLVYLANRIAVADSRGGSQAVPYSTVAALEFPIAEGFPRLLRPGGEPVGPVERDGILINTWTAEQLGLAPAAASGSESPPEIRLDYFAVDARDRLVPVSRTFPLAGVVAMAGLGADASLTPELPGLSDADDMAAWDPPFPVRLEAIRSQDEEYWDRHRGTPKAFVPLEVGQELWGTRFGHLTTLRLAPGKGRSAEELARALGRALPREVELRAAGIAVLPVARQGREAARGATDFTGLFLGFSMFLIAAAALVVSLLFRLAVEQRGSEIGLRRALGFSQRSVTRQLLGEGMVLATAGAAFGTALAVAYAGGLLRALDRWWAPLLAPGSGGEAGAVSFLRLVVSPASLGAGFLAAVLVVALVIWLALRRLRQVSATALLAGVTEPARDRAASGEEGRWSPRVAVVAGVLGIGALAVGLGTAFTTTTTSSSPMLFFLAGSALLLAGCATVAAWWGGGGGTPGVRPELPRWLGLGHLAARNGARHPARSLLSVALVACATFVLVAVAANRKGGGHGGEGGAVPGTGGWDYLAEAAVALPRDPTTEEGAAALGLSPESRQLLAEARLLPLRLKPGEDASCLNLYQPENPRILGIPVGAMEPAGGSPGEGPGGFRFRGRLHVEDPATERLLEEDPWRLLSPGVLPPEILDGAVPVIGDYASVRWILKLGLGDTLTVPAAGGGSGGAEGGSGEVTLRIVGLLEGSMFQSELLMGEEHFRRAFPDHGGWGAFLLDAPAEVAEELSRNLERELDRFGFDAVDTAERLAAYHAVENVYLTTFQALGGLGLLLGTLGLGVVLARNVLERRGELATLRSFGFRRRTLGWMVAAENGVLLVLGLGIGTLAGLAAVAPHLLAGGGALPWGALGLTLGLVFVAGMLAGGVAVRFALAVPLLGALKAE